MVGPPIVIFPIGGREFERWSFQLLIFLADVDFVSNGFFFEVILFVDGAFGEIEFDGVELAEMSATCAILADTHCGMMVLEIGFIEAF
jgi:hypothetical protein